MSWLLAAIAALAAQGSDPGTFRNEYHCAADRLVRGRSLEASQVSLADGTILGTRWSWTDQPLTPIGQPLPREGVFLSARWGMQGMPADPEALRRSLDMAIVRITVIMPRRLRRPPFLRLIGPDSDGPWLTPGGLAEVNGVYAWASVDVRWGTLRTEAGPEADSLGFALGHGRSAPIVEGRIDLAPVAEVLAAVPALLGDLPTGAARTERCRLRRMRYVPIPVTRVPETR